MNKTTKQSPTGSARSYLDLTAKYSKIAALNRKTLNGREKINNRTSLSLLLDVVVSIHQLKLKLRNMYSLPFTAMKRVQTAKVFTYNWPFQCDGWPTDRLKNLKSRLFFFILLLCPRESSVRLTERVSLITIVFYYGALFLSLAFSLMLMVH